jgi:hypothetical protein
MTCLFSTLKDCVAPVYYIRCFYLDHGNHEYYLSLLIIIFWNNMLFGFIFVVHCEIRSIKLYDIFLLGGECLSFANKIPVNRESDVV